MLRSIVRTCKNTSDPAWSGILKFWMLPRIDTMRGKTRGTVWVLVVAAGVISCLNRGQLGQVRLRQK